MLEGLVNYSPSPILGYLANLPLYWYGFFYLVAIVLGYLIVDQTLKRIGDDKSNHLREILPQFTFWLVLWGIVGARLYHVLNEWQFYITYPQLILRIDLGGLAIHGALIGGALYLYYLAGKLIKTSSPLNSKFIIHNSATENIRGARFKMTIFLTDLISPAILLGQSLGRWGNYFNQELYGRPTELPWGIFISPENRLSGYESFTHFHPVFFYEFTWHLIGALILILFIFYVLRSSNSYNVQHTAYSFAPGTGATTALYILFASSGRIIAELFRIDPTPDILGIRLPLLVSTLLLLISVLYISKMIYNTHIKRTA